MNNTNTQSWIENSNCQSTCRGMIWKLSHNTGICTYVVLCMYITQLSITIVRFHGVWLDFRRTKVGVCIWCSCVLFTGKKYTLSFYHWCQKINEAAFLKVKAPLYSCLLITFCPPKVGQLIGICKPSIRDNPRVCGRPSVYVKLMLNLLI